MTPHSHTNNLQKKLLRVDVSHYYDYLIFTLHKNIFKEVVVMLLHLFIGHICDH